MLNKMIRIIISALFLFISCTPANVTMAVKAIEVASDLVTILDFFDRSLNEFQGSINQAKFYLDSDNNISSDKKAIAWEEEWKLAGIKLESIHEHYKKVEEQIEQYFLALDRETDVIQSIELRKSEHKKNKKLLKNWNTVKKKFTEQINLADAIEKEGRDIKQVLILAAMRNKLEEKVSHVLELHKRLTKVNDELSDLTTQTRKLLGLKPSKVAKSVNSYKVSKLNEVSANTNHNHSKNFNSKEAKEILEMLTLNTSSANAKNIDLHMSTISKNCPNYDITK